MYIFRYVSCGILVAAAACVFFMDLPWWEKVVILAWPAAVVAVNEYREHKRRTAAAEQAGHVSNSVPDQLLHAYRERP